MRKRISFMKVLTPVLFALALICLITTLVICGRLGVFDDRYDAVREYAELLGKISDIYIGEYETGEVGSAAMHAAVDSLGDRWSYYMTPDELAYYLDSVNNRYAGIGVGVVIDDETGGMRVSYVYRNSPADLAGIEAGDVITGVDGEAVAGLSLDEMKGRLARPIGDTVVLTVLRSDGTVEELSASYSYVFIDPVSFELLENGVGYLALENFDAGAADSFINAVDELQRQGATSLLFDVRGNGGGRLVEMAEILDYLLPEGEIFVAVDRNGNEDITLSGPEYVDLPMAVLIDRYSFSAAEYFAAMLREYGRAVLIGEQTTGKNRMQTTVLMSNGGALHISSSQYLTRNRVSLYDAGGVTPDHLISLTDDEYILYISGKLEKSDDPQLRQALLVLTNNG